MPSWSLAELELVADHWGVPRRPRLAPRTGGASVPPAVMTSDERIPANRSGAPAESDELLMQRYQRGDEQAFRELYARHRSPLLRFVRRLSPGPADADEVIQETWMAVVQGRERYRPQSSFAAYLFSIGRRRTMDRWRRRGRSPDRDADALQLDHVPGATEHEPDARADNATLRAALIAAVAALPILQRETFLLRAEGGLGIDEIAAVTETNRETTRSRLRFALRRLRIALEDWHDH